MIKVEDAKYVFAGSGADLIDDTYAVLQAFLISSLQTYGYSEAECARNIRHLTEKAIKTFIEDNKKHEANTNDQRNAN